MNPLVSLLEPAVLAVAANLIPGQSNVRDMAARLLGGVAVMLFLVSLTTALICFASYLANHFDGQTALLIFSSSLFSFSLLFGGVAYVVYRYRQLKMRVYEHVLLKKAEELVGDAREELENVTQLYPKTATTLAAAAGYMTARRAGEGTTQMLRMLDKLL